MKRLSIYLTAICLVAVLAAPSWGFSVAGAGVELMSEVVEVHVILAGEESTDLSPTPVTINGLGSYFATRERAEAYVESLQPDRNGAPSGPWDDAGWLVRQDYGPMVQQQAPMPGESMVVDVETLAVRAGAVVWEFALWDGQRPDARDKLMKAATTLFAGQEPLTRAVVLIPERVEAQGRDLGLVPQPWTLQDVDSTTSRDLVFSYDSSIPVDLSVGYKAVQADFLPGEVRVAEDRGYDLAEAVIDLGDSPQAVELSPQGMVSAATDSLTRFRAVTVVLRSRPGAEASVFGPMVRLFLRDTEHPWSPPEVVHPDEDDGWTGPMLAYVERFFCRDREAFATLLDEDGGPDCSYLYGGHGYLSRLLREQGLDQDRVFRELVRRTQARQFSGDALDNEVELALYIHGLPGVDIDLEALLEDRLAWPHHKEDFLEPTMWSAATARAVLNDLALFEAAGSPDWALEKVRTNAIELAGLVLGNGRPVAYTLDKDTSASIRETDSPLPLALAAMACLKAEQLFGELIFTDGALAMLELLNAGHSSLRLVEVEDVNELSRYRESAVSWLALASEALILGGDRLGVGDYQRSGEQLRNDLLAAWDGDAGGIPMLVVQGEGGYAMLPYRLLDDQLAVLRLARGESLPWW